MKCVCVWLYERDLRLAVLAEDDAFGELLWWLSGGCACGSSSGSTLRGRRVGRLRFCAVGGHLDVLRCAGKSRSGKLNQ